MILKRLIPLLTLLAVAAAEAAPLQQRARQEAQLNTLAMPDDWANWQATWRHLSHLGIRVQDTDMSSAQALAKLQSEGMSGQSDLADVGLAYAPLAQDRGLTQAHKTAHWAQIPDWAKDPEGHWALSYTGTIAFLVDREQVPLPPRSWQDLLDGRYRITVGDVGAASQANNVVLAAAFALGGDEGDLSPALDLFRQLAAKRRLDTQNPSLERVRDEGLAVVILWDFNALAIRAALNNHRYEVLIPEDGSVQSGYSTLISRNAPHPNAAKWAREYILSDQGQLNLALGFARPIRLPYLNLSPSVKSRLLPVSSYQHVRRIEDLEIWSRSSKQLPALWQAQVMQAGE